jgi:hypothetical protein
MRTELGWRVWTGFAVLGFLLPPGAARAEEKPRVYENRLTPIAKPQPLLADYPEFVEPIKEIGRFEAPTLVDDPGADLDVRAWRFSYNARGIIEMPNRLRADRTAVIVVHPWGVDDGQGWKTPEPAGVVDFCTLAKNQLAGRHTRKVVNPFLKSLRGKVGLVMHSLPGKEDAIRKKLYRSFRGRPSARDRAQGAKELAAKLKGFSYKGQPLSQRLRLSADKPVVDYFRQFPGLDAGARYNNAGFWDLPIPVTRDIDVDLDDVVIYDAEGYPALKMFLKKQGIRNILLTGYATDMCFCRTTAGYKNLSQDFNVFLVGDATLATFPANASPRYATNAAISFAALDQLVTQVSWIKYDKGKEGGRKSTSPQRQQGKQNPSVAVRAGQAVCLSLAGFPLQQLGQVPQFHGFVPAARGQRIAVRRDGQGRNLGGVRPEAGPLCPGGRIPKSHHADLVRRGQQLAVRRERQGRNRPSVSQQHAQLFVLGNVPEPHALIVGGQGQSLGVRGELRQPNQARKALEGAEIFLAIHVPDGHGHRMTGSGQRLAVGRTNQGGQLIGRHGKVLPELARGYFPALHVGVPSSSRRHQGLAIRREGYGWEGAGHVGQLVFAGHVPQLGSRPDVHRGQRFAIRRELDRADLTGMSFESGPCLVLSQVPEGDHLVGGPRGQDLAIRRPGQAIHLVAVLEGSLDTGGGRRHWLVGGLLLRGVLENKVERHASAHQHEQEQQQQKNQGTRTGLRFLGPDLNQVAHRRGISNKGREYAGAFLEA